MNLQRIAAVIPWTTVLILATAVVMETIARGADDRTHLCEMLALSLDRPYTLLTYWTSHTDSGHAKENIVQWLVLASLAERRLHTKWLTLSCAVTTLVVGSIILAAMSTRLTSDPAGKGLSIIGWMVILPAAATLLNWFTGSNLKLWTGVLLALLASILAAVIKAEVLWPFDVGMLGHIGGTFAGFVVTVIAWRAGKYEPRTRSGGQEYAVTLMLVFLVLVALFEASVVINSDF